MSAVSIVLMTIDVLGVPAALFLFSSIAIFFKQAVHDGTGVWPAFKNAAPLLIGALAFCALWNITRIVSAITGVVIVLIAYKI